MTRTLIMNALKVDFVLIVLRNISRIADLEDIKRGSEECDNRRDDEKLFFPAPMMSGRTYATAKARTPDTEGHSKRLSGCNQKAIDRTSPGH
jgi:hypothetical protein